MKPATEPAEGIVETTTRRRIIPVSEEQKPPDVWEYLRAIKPQDWAKHIVYVYRTEPGPKVQLFRCTEQITTTPGGQRVPIADEQELEAAITREFGGGTFRLLVKCGPQIVSAGSLEIGAPVRPIRLPIEPVPGANGAGGTPPIIGGDATAVVAGRAFDALSMQERQSAEIGFAAMKTAADVMQRFASGGGGVGGDDLTRQLMAVMIQRMLAPPPDPLDLLTKLLALQAQLNPQRGQDETTAQIMKAALDRLLNPAPTGAPVSATAELVRSLPAIGSQFVEGVRALAEARKAEAQIVAMSRAGVQPPMQPNPQMLPPATQPAPAPTNGAPNVDFVDKKIVEIMQRPGSAEQAADEAMAFIQELDPNALSELAKLGEAGLIQFFHSRPLLKPATANMPRLIEFIRAFLRIYAEDEAKAQGAQGANPPGKPLPN